MKRFAVLIAMFVLPSCQPLHQVLRQIRFSKVMDSLMLDEVTSRASPTEVACRWLQNNEDVWQKWLPDPTKCFQHFGLHDGSSFVENRDDPTGLHCTACTSGFKSSVLRDGKGITYVCIACALGTFQNEGASLDCKKCPLGEYQDQNATRFCFATLSMFLQCASFFYFKTSLSVTMFVLGHGSFSGARADSSLPRQAVPANDVLQVSTRTLKDKVSAKTVQEP